MKKVIIIILCLSWFFLFSFYLFGEADQVSSKQYAVERAGAFHPAIGEEFIYTLNWGIVPAGSASLRLDSEVECGDSKCYKIKTSSSTNPFFDKIYKVRDTVESLIDTSWHRSYYYNKRQQEGKFRRNDELIFDYRKAEVQLKRNGQSQNSIKINGIEDLLDPLGVLYYVRSLNLRVGNTIEARITDGKALYLMKINVIKREKVKTWVGSFNCLKVEPKMEKIEGIFYKKEKAKLYVWLTDDQAKIPVKLESEAKVGSFQGLLKEWKKPL